MSKISDELEDTVLDYLPFILLGAAVGLLMVLVDLLYHVVTKTSII